MSLCVHRFPESIDIDADIERSKTVLSEQVVQLTDGVTTGVFAYEDSGGEGLPVVLLHGFVCNRQMWRSQFAELGRTHRVISLDFPGHGASVFPVDADIYSEDRFADLVVDFLATLGLDKVVLVGFSMGGGVALNIAHRHPSVVEALVLADAGGGSADPDQHRRSMRDLESFVGQHGFEAFVDRMLESQTFSGYADRSALARQHMRSIIMQSDADGLPLVITGVLGSRQPVQERSLEELGVPTLVLVGELDRACRDAADELARRIPNAALEVFDGSAHMTPLEDPQRFTNRLGAFLESIAGTRSPAARESAVVSTSNTRA